MRGYAESGLYPADIPAAEFTREQRPALYYQGPTKIRFNRITKSMLAKERVGMQKHIGEFVDRAVTFIAARTVGEHVLLPTPWNPGSTGTTVESGVRHHRRCRPPAGQYLSDYLG